MRIDLIPAGDNPPETLNVLITVMSEGEITVPRLGRVAAAPGFRLVAAMNGTLELRDTPGGGLTAVVMIPSARHSS